MVRVGVNNRQNPIRSGLLVANARAASTLGAGGMGDAAATAAAGRRVAGLRWPWWLCAQQSLARLVVLVPGLLLARLLLVVLSQVMMLVLVLVLVLAVRGLLLNKRVEVWLHTRLNRSRV